MGGEDKPGGGVVGSKAHHLEEDALLRVIAGGQHLRPQLFPLHLGNAGGLHRLAHQPAVLAIPQAKAQAEVDDAADHRAAEESPHGAVEGVLGAHPVHKGHRPHKEGKEPQGDGDGDVGGGAHQLPPVPGDPFGFVVHPCLVVVSHFDVTSFYCCCGLSRFSKKNRISAMTAISIPYIRRGFAWGKLQREVRENIPPKIVLPQAWRRTAAQTLFVSR